METLKIKNFTDLIAWQTIKDDLPKLKKDIEKLL